jgi:hypothetical protein
MQLVSPFRALLVVGAIVACSMQASAAVITLDFAGNVVDTSTGFPALGTPVTWTVRYDTSMTEISRDSVPPTTSTFYSTTLPGGSPAAVIHLPTGDLISGLDLSLSLVDNEPGSVFVDNFHGFSTWSGGGLQYQLVYGNDMWENFLGGLPAVGAELPASLPQPPLFTIGLLDASGQNVLLHIEGRAGPQVVDAPATLALFGIGALAVFVNRRRKRSV